MSACRSHRSRETSRVRGACLDDLYGVQVTVHSLLDALACGCGVIAIDFGWVACSVPGWHCQHSYRNPERRRRLARRSRASLRRVDILGGRFAAHGAGLEEVAPGEVCTFAPDTLEWMPTGMGHAALVEFLLPIALDVFYADLRWAGWEGAVRRVPLDQGLAAYPFPWSQELATSSAVCSQPVRARGGCCSAFRGTDSRAI